MNITENIKAYWNRAYPSIFVAFGFVFFACGMFLFMVGFHNFDGSQNYRYINSLINNEGNSIHLKETFISGEKVELDDSYRLGLRQLFLGMLAVVMGAMLFSSGVTMLEYRAKIIK